MPEWLTEGKTILIPKYIETANSQNYRPVTYLPLISKAFTAIISQRMSKYLEEINTFPEEHKDELLMNKIISEDSCRYLNLINCFPTVAELQYDRKCWLCPLMDEDMYFSDDDQKW